MDPIPTKTTERAWIALHRAHRHLLEQVESRLKREGLPPLDWYDVLLELERAGEAGLRPFQIGERVLLNKYNLSRLVDRLQREGLARRESCAEDGRGHRVLITAAGAALLRRVWPVYAEVIKTSFAARLDQGEARSLATILARILPAPSD